MITAPSEALEYLDRLANLQRQLNRQDARIARAEALLRGRKRQRAELLKLRDRMMADTIEDRALFSLVRPDGQPAGLVAGEGPGAILGARSNTLRPVEVTDGEACDEVRPARRDGPGRDDGVSPGEPVPALGGPGRAGGAGPAAREARADQGGDVGAGDAAWRGEPIEALGLPDNVASWMRDMMDIATIGHVWDVLSDGDPLEQICGAEVEASEVREALARYRAAKGWGAEDGIPEAWLAPPRTCRACGCTEFDACPGGCSWVGEEDLCDSCEWLREGPPPASEIPAAPITIGECHEIERKAKLPKTLAKTLAKAEGLLGERIDDRNAAELVYALRAERWEREKGEPAYVHDLAAARIRLAAAKAQEIAWEGIVGSIRNILHAPTVNKANATRAKGKAKSGGPTPEPLAGTAKAVDPRDVTQVVFDGVEWHRCLACKGDHDQPDPARSGGRCHRPRREVFAIRDVAGEWRDAPLWELELLRGERESLEQDHRIDTVGKLSDHLRDHGWTFIDQEHGRIVGALADFKDVVERNHRLAEERRAAEAKSKSKARPRPRTPRSAADVRP